jgi:hypothetical protein
MKDWGEVLLWFFVGCIIVLLVTHAGNFSTSITSVGNTANMLSEMLVNTQYSKYVGNMTSSKAGYNPPAPSK